jgi:hypothetical protein
MISAPARLIAVFIDTVFPLSKLHGGRVTAKSNSFDQAGLGRTGIPLFIMGFLALF